MLAEIFFLGLETMVRASEAQAKNSRFAPLPRDAFPGFGETRAKGNGKDM